MQRTAPGHEAQALEQVRQVVTQVVGDQEEVRSLDGVDGDPGPLPHYQTADSSQPRQNV